MFLSPSLMMLEPQLLVVAPDCFVSQKPKFLGMTISAILFLISH
jgi:hypothetical protein